MGALAVCHTVFGKKGWKLDGKPQKRADISKASLFVDTFKFFS